MIRLDNISVYLPDFSMENIDLTIEKGEFFTLLGPTGSGKTLLLESIAGLVPLSEGRIEVQGRDVTGLPPEKRGISLVYQDHALFPHMTVRQNILYGMRFQKNGQKNSGQQIEFLIRQLGIDHLLNRFPSHLSGGERQRTALARALAVQPQILLLDEPLSSLDPNFREEIREMISRLHQQTGVTVLLVTHDFTEAHSLGQRAAIIHSGCLEQIGSIQTVFYRPATPFVADFVGMKNFFSATIKDRQAVFGGDFSLHINSSSDSPKQYVAVRPEHVHIHTTPVDAEGGNCFKGEIIRIIHQGFYSEIEVAAFGLRWRAVMLVNDVLEKKLAPGQPVFLEVDSEDIHLM